MKPFFRYPGGKSKIAKRIVRTMLERCPSDSILDYREPFLGGGSVGLELLQHLDPGTFVWINDANAQLAGIWAMVLEDPQQLVERISSYEPRVEDFYAYKSILQGNSDKTSLLDRAIMHLIMSQISYSGLGAMSGGPLGGKDQKSKYKIDCRWSPKNMCKKILRAHELLSKFDVRCTSCNYTTLLESVTDNTVIYVDPPFFMRGDQLYQQHFSFDDHKILSERLKELDCNWFLSYDDCLEVRELYSWTDITELSQSYTLNNRGKVTELLISKFEPNVRQSSALRRQFLDSV
jgi:DNA adenine methylase